MKAAKMEKRPSFSLMKQTDVQSVYHMQMPRWLFSDSRYCEMSLDAKVAYTFLLNRFQLSRLNGWINEFGEVFVVFPRKEMARELRVGEKRVTAAFKELADRGLIWEKRCGLCAANQIYLALVQPMDDPDYECAPFMDRGNSGGSGAADPALPEPSNPRFRNSRSNDPGAVIPTLPEQPAAPPSKKELNHTYRSQKEVSQSIPRARDDRLTDADENELTEILNSCELDLFPDDTARVFENAIERLFYSESLRVGKAILPQNRVRSRLHRLNEIILRDVEQKMAENTERPIRNTTAYIMSLIFNSIAESESDLLVDPYLNTLRASP